MNPRLRTSSSSPRMDWISPSATSIRSPQVASQKGQVRKWVSLAAATAGDCTRVGCVTLLATERGELLPRELREQRIEARRRLEQAIEDRSGASLLTGVGGDHSRVVAEDRVAVAEPVRPLRQPQRRAGPARRVETPRVGVGRGY